MKLLLRKIYYSIPVQWRYVFRRVYFFPSDLLSDVTKSRTPMEPRKGEIFVGSGDFTEQGQHQVKLLKKYTNISEDSSVLDIGCGIGRTAVALTEVLSDQGAYKGFDVVERGINWCLKNISGIYPNFDFKFVPLHNDLYNKHTEAAHQFKFPYADEAFDTVCLFSVFTHMQIDEIQSYLSQIDRVLQNGGVCLATFFSYADEDVSMLTTQKGLQFPIDKEGYRLMSSITKSANVAVSYHLIQQMTEELQLSIVEYVEGYWKESVAKDTNNSFQDILVFRK